jgi:hypothetical protein
VEAAQKMMSILWFSLLIAMAGYTILSFFANVRTTPNAIVLRAMSIVAAAEVIALFVLRRKMLVTGHGAAEFAKRRCCSPRALEDRPYRHLGLKPERCAV